MDESALASELIRRPSVTPEDKGCQDIVERELEKVGFSRQKMNLSDVTNSLYTIGSGRPLLLFLGHTDVVPAGNLDRWKHPPFSPTVENGCLFGRGACDMKGGIAAFVAACCDFMRARPAFIDENIGSINMLLTSNEEGVTENGAKKSLAALSDQGVLIDFCLVGEPSSQTRVGDTIKYGRRGSASCTLKIFGKQGHAAYPQFAENSVHLSIPFLQKIVDIKWGTGNADFPPSSLQIVNVRAGTGADNVIPGEIEVDFNIRYSSELTPALIKKKVNRVLQDVCFRHETQWTFSAQPFLSRQGKFIQLLEQAVFDLCGYMPERSTGGGTSDGRFVPASAEIAELGVTNRTAHCVDECVTIQELSRLKAIYIETLTRIFPAAL